MISVLLLFAMLASIFIWPNMTPWISLGLLVIGIGMPISLTTQKHWRMYAQAECPLEKMVGNLSLELLGFLLTMGSAMYVGGAIGVYVGLRKDIWLGLLASFAGGFFAAWIVRSAWRRLFLLRI